MGVRTNIKVQTTMEVLLVEDNPGDQMLAEEAFNEADFPVHLSIVDDGLQALAFLRKEQEFEDAPRPQLILLDLNMPKMGGRAVLEKVKSDPLTPEIPVVVPTTSGNPADVQACYGAHANSYVRKPSDMDGFNKVVRELEQYWFQVVNLP